uniref:Uncharacterized protein n=1 Tax=Zea mays TaxID=4577 RepID=A0A804MC88_MAIZE
MSSPPPCSTEPSPFTAQATPGNDADQRRSHRPLRARPTAPPPLSVSRIRAATADTAPRRPSFPRLPPRPPHRVIGSNSRPTAAHLGLGAAVAWMTLPLEAAQSAPAATGAQPSPLRSPLPRASRVLFPAIGDLLRSAIGETCKIVPFVSDGHFYEQLVVRRCRWPGVPGDWLPHLPQAHGLRDILPTATTP